jgi:hypothetical protein
MSRPTGSEVEVAVDPSRSASVPVVAERSAAVLSRGDGTTLLVGGTVVVAVLLVLDTASQTMSLLVLAASVLLAWRRVGHPSEVPEPAS